jgi:hypothetical protein
MPGITDDFYRLVTFDDDTLGSARSSQHNDELNISKGKAERKAERQEPRLSRAKSRSRSTECA